MKTNIKLKRILVLTIVGLILVLSATFFYINNDLITSKARRADTPDSVVAGNQGRGVGTTSVTDTTGVADEASLDAVFGEGESADNFDDIVM